MKYKEWVKEIVRSYEERDDNVWVHIEWTQDEDGFAVINEVFELPPEGVDAYYASGGVWSYWDLPRTLRTLRKHLAELE